MIIYAMDSQGKVWQVNNPNLPENLVCPLCGVPMYPKSSPLGNRFFAVFPGCAHTHDACRSLDGSVEIHDILLTKSDSFWRRVIGQPPKPSNDPPKINDDVEDAGHSDPDGLSDANGPASPGDSNLPDESTPPNDSGESSDANSLNTPVDHDDADSPIDPDNVFFDNWASLLADDTPEGVVDFGDMGIPAGPGVERTKGMYALSHFAATGHLDCDDCVLADGALLSDFTVNPRFSYKLLELLAINYRILQGKPQKFFDWAQTIRIKVFIALDAMGQRINRFKVADVHIPDEKLYKKIRNMLFESYSDCETGRTKVRPRYERVAVAGDWSSIQAGECRCGWDCSAYGWTCAGLVCTDVYRMGCVFAFPNREEKK